MAVKIAAYANSDDAFIVWDPGAPMTGCTGFALQREYMTGPKKGTTDFVNNRIDFSAPKDSALGPVSSDKSPFRRFTWTDHEVNSGDEVRYRAIPVTSTGLNEAAASKWTPAVKLSARVDDTTSCFFNRGLVISQFVTRYLQDRKMSLSDFKKEIADGGDAANAHEENIRAFLGGDLLKELAALLATVKKNGSTLYAALFELSDAQILDALASLGANAHVVLANGSDKSGDENKSARAALKKAGVKVYDRMLKSKGLGHNKFAVVCDGNEAKQVWTGSTNWAPTGLCTQMNNGILVDDADLAKTYKAQWDALQAAGNDFPDDLVENNSAPRELKIGASSTTVWFTRTSEGQDMQALYDLIFAARDGILFLMFMPGNDGPQNAIASRLAPASPHYDPNLLVHGVVSTLPNKGDPKQLDVQLVNRGKASPAFRLNVLQPDGIAHPFSHWAAEVTRKQFLAQVGHAIVHSKVLVIDPFGAKPIVVTGSHNFSSSASHKNDENLMIVEGNSALAAAYALNVQAVFDHYRWRAFLGEHDDKQAPFTGDWQAGLFTDEKKRERAFWL